MKKGVSLLEPILFVVVLLLMIGGAFYLGTKYFSSGAVPEAQNAPTSAPMSQSLPPQAISEPLFSGTVQKINKDLGLFIISDTDKENGVPDSITYYEAGIYKRGEFKDYTRILAIRPSEGPGPSLQFLLATKDYSSYVLDDPLNKTANYPTDDYDNPYMYLDKSKITKTVILDTDHPSTIDIQKPFMLIKKDSALLESIKAGKKDKNGYDIYIEAPITNFKGSALLSSSQSQLQLYSGGTDWTNSQPQNEKEKSALATRKTYLNNTTLVQGKDSTGLTYSYVLSTEKDVAVYVSKASADEQKNIDYKRQVAQYNEKKLKEYPSSPEYSPFPGLRFVRNAVGLDMGFYNSYDAAFPGACGGTTSTYVVDGVKDSDLQLVSSSSEYSLYTLKNSNHPLNVLAYQTKTDQGDESFKSVNAGLSIPSLSDYVAKHPLLFFKDAWGRWVVVGEYDLKLMGGCGKPVVYLYPEKQTTVHLSFVSLVALNTQIPQYANGWLVSARPNGTLTDLQPQYTDCSKIDKADFGSEYAYQACKNNIYPYIYWSGKSVENTYPKVTGGWIVEKGSLASFIGSKLKEIGLTTNESNDMISYWVPKMSEKNMQYYQVRFIQTQDMNAFIPMEVNPRPDSVIRVFLDWKALNQRPTVEPLPQDLKKYSRNGFTLVEWGGLQQP